MGAWCFTLFVILRQKFVPLIRQKLQQKVGLNLEISGYWPSVGVISCGNMYGCIHCLWKSWKFVIYNPRLISFFRATHFNNNHSQFRMRCVCGVRRNNNNNNNSHDSVYGAIIMNKVIARVHPVHLMNVDLGCKSTSRPYDKCGANRAIELKWKMHWKDPCHFA